MGFGKLQQKIADIQKFMVQPKSTCKRNNVSPWQQLGDLFEKMTNNAGHSILQ